MTRLPGRHRLSGEQVLLFLQNIRDRLTVIPLSGEEYHGAIKDAAGAGVVGGTIYEGVNRQLRPESEGGRYLHLEHQACSIARTHCFTARSMAPEVGDLFISLIHTCELNGANSFHYLTELQRHAPEVAANPSEWMPWNYCEMLGRSGGP